MPQGSPRLFQTEPSGTFSEWTANAIGRNSKAIREYLEKNFEETEGKGTVTLALQALLETVEPTSKMVEVAVVTAEGVKYLLNDEVDAVIKEIEDEKAAKAAQPGATR